MKSKEEILNLMQEEAAKGESKDNVMMGGILEVLFDIRGLLVSVNQKLIQCPKKKK